MSKLKYVHATGSAILPMLTLTDYTLTSINDLMFKHHLAPMTGEISDAIRGLASRADIAFAPISNNGTYGLQNVVQGYGFSRCKDNARVKSTDALLVELNKLIKYGMFNLNRFIADALHAKQVGLLPSTGALITDDKQLAEYINKIENSRTNYLTRLQYLYIVVKYFEIYKEKSYIRGSNKNLEIDNFIDTLVAENFQLPNFFTASEEQRIEFAHKILARLIEKFPGIEQDLRVNPNLYTDADGFIFKDFYNKHNVYDFFNCVDTGGDTSFSSFMQERGRHLLVPKLTFKDGEIFSTEFSQRVFAINSKFDFLIQVLNGNIGKRFGADMFAKFDTEQFPIAFFLSEEDDAKVSSCGYEFRSTQNLALGSDIKNIGVKPENLAALQKFLTENSLADKITILNIDTLEVLAEPTPISHTVKSASAKAAAPVLWSAPGVQKQPVMLQVPPVALKPTVKALPTQSERKPSELELAFAKFKRG